MKSKIFLTSIIALAFMCPAMAVDGNATIENGDTCNVDNLGTSTNNDTANIEAIWTPTQYQCSAGQYLYIDANVAECRACTAGSFCGGGNYTVESHANDILACSSLGDGSYTLSAESSDENIDCYKTCSASCTQPSAPAHSTNVVYGTETASGEHHYGSSCNAVAPTCSITFDCVSGYHKIGSSTLTSEERQKIEYLKENPEAQQYLFAQLQQNYGRLINPLSGQDTETLKKGEFFVGGNIDSQVIFSYGEASCNNYEGTIEREADHFDFESDAVKSPSELNTSSVGNSCWCRIKYFMTTSEATGLIENDMSSDWINVYHYNNSSSCLSDCVNSCANVLIYSFDYYSNKGNARDRFVETMTYSEPSCVANNIKLDWYNDTVANNGTQIEPTNDAANQCSYSGTITVPTNTMQKAGYTFGGWKLRTTTTPTE